MTFQAIHETAISSVLGEYESELVRTGERHIDYGSIIFDYAAAAFEEVDVSPQWLLSTVSDEPSLLDTDVDGKPLRELLRDAFRQILEDRLFDHLQTYGESLDQSGTYSPK